MTALVPAGWWWQGVTAWEGVHIDEMPKKNYATTPKEIQFI